MMLIPTKEALDLAIKTDLEILGLLDPTNPAAAALRAHRPRTIPTCSVGYQAGRLTGARGYALFSCVRSFASGLASSRAAR